MTNTVFNPFGQLLPQHLFFIIQKELFDKDIFLYYEEKVLGQKLAKKGLKTVLVMDQSYIHAHSVSVDKSIRRIGDKQQLLHESKLYYYKTYLGAGPVKLAAARAWLAFVLAEGTVFDPGLPYAVVGRDKRLGAGKEEER